MHKFLIPFLMSAVCIGVSTFSVAVPHAAAQQENFGQTYDPTSGTAGNQNSEKIRELKRQSMGEKGFIVPNVVTISLVHPGYLNTDQVGIQMGIPDVVTGCYQITPLEYEAQFVDPYFLDIKVKHYRRIAPEGVVSVKECSQSNQTPGAMMVLSRKDLLSRGTQAIRFSTEAGTDIYTLSLDGERLSLVPESMMIFRAQGLSGPLKDRIVYSFSSDRLIALQVPMAKRGDQLSTVMETFARNHGLSVPKDTEGLETSNGTGAIFFFHDDGGKLIEKMGDKDYVEVGKIMVDRPYDGPEGRTKTGVELSVFATRPGMRL